MRIYYAIFNHTNDKTIPVGVVLWNPETKQYILKFFNDHAFVLLIKKKIHNWISKQSLPYNLEQIFPYQTEWWDHVRKLLIHRTRLSATFEIECDSLEDAMSEIIQI